MAVFSTVRYSYVPQSGGAQAPAAPLHSTRSLADAVSGAQQQQLTITTSALLARRSSSLPPSSSTSHGFVRRSASTSSVFPLSLGRHSRYLVSCLTAGAKRCVGFGPFVAIDLFLPAFCLLRSLLGFFRSSSQTDCPSRSWYLGWLAPRAIDPPPKARVHTVRNTSRDLAPLQVKRRFCDLAGALGYPFKIPLLSLGVPL
ncbi:hypothetical protein BDW69DRAFT_121793 [Aspergillus filifer]